MQAARLFGDNRLGQTELKWVLKRQTIGEFHNNNIKISFRTLLFNNSILYGSFKVIVIG